MPRPRFPIGRTLHLGAYFLLVIATAAWAATALSFHVTGALLIAAWIALGATLIAGAIAAFKSPRAGWLMLALVAGVTAGWYQTIRPSQDRDWAFDVARGVQARVAGGQVQLENVRNFEWQSPDAATPSWEGRSYDLDTLASVDMITSVWDSPDIAHLIVSFGFSDGQRVAFSVETRRESHEAFNTIGGFFRQFELVLIAATEEDTIKLRTNHRREDVRLYPLNLNAEQRRNLFLSYINLANQLEDNPAFYNTLTRNCTTTVYPLASSIKQDMTLDWRVLLSGHLPDYIEQLGGFEGQFSVAEREERAAITPLALAAQGGDYSDAIRANYAAK